jgi:hypothetical protein
MEITLYREATASELLRALRSSLLPLPPGPLDLRSTSNDRRSNALICFASSRRRLGLESSARLPQILAQDAQPCSQGGMKPREASHAWLGNTSDGISLKKRRCKRRRRNAGRPVLVARCKVRPPGQSSDFQITILTKNRSASGRVGLLIKRGAMGVGVLLGAGSTRIND